MRLRLKRLTIILVCSLTAILLLTNKDNGAFQVDLIANIKSMKNVKTCGRFPSENDIFRDNVYWQISNTPKGFMKLFNAYLDTRMNRTVVRVTAISVEINLPNDTIFCQFWFKDFPSPYIVKASEALLLWQRAWGLMKSCKFPYLITCPIEFDGELPTSVSVTTNPCDDAENKLDIIDNQPPKGVKQKFGVCTKQLKYGGREFIVRFIEWIHLLQLMGVSKVHMTVTEVHEEMVGVLEYFENLGYIEWNRYKDPTEIADHRMFSSQHRYLQMLVINDCFYRTKDLYERIVLIDPDEIMVPMMETDFTWEDILNRLNSSFFESDSLAFANIYFPNIRGEKRFSEIPNYNYMLQHVKRSKNELKPFNIHKSFFNPGNVLAVHNHRSFRCIRSKTYWCRLSKVPTSIAQLNHYRNTVKERFTNGTNEDRTLWKYKKELVKAVDKTLNHLNFEPL